MRRGQENLLCLVWKEDKNKVTAAFSRNREIVVLCVHEGWTRSWWFNLQWRGFAALLGKSCKLKNSDGRGPLQSLWDPLHGTILCRGGRSKASKQGEESSILQCVCAFCHSVFLQEKEFPLDFNFQLKSFSALPVLSWSSKDLFAHFHDFSDLSSYSEGSPKAVTTRILLSVSHLGFIVHIPMLCNMKTHLRGCNMLIIGWKENIDISLITIMQTGKYLASYLLAR